MLLLSKILLDRRASLRWLCRTRECLVCPATKVLDNFRLQQRPIFTSSIIRRSSPEQTQSSPVPEKDSRIP